MVHNDMFLCVSFAGMKQTSLFAVMHTGLKNIELTPLTYKFLNSSECERHSTVFFL